MLELYISTICAVMACAYTTLLEENALLFWWWKLLSGKLNEGRKPQWKKYLYNLLTCPLCLSGQFALWTYLVLIIKSQNGPVFYDLSQFIDNTFLSLIFTISLSILTAKFIQRWS